MDIDLHQLIQLASHNPSVYAGLSVSMSDIYCRQQGNVSQLHYLLGAVWVQKTFPTALPKFHKSLITNTMDTQGWIQHGEINACHGGMLC